MKGWYNMEINLIDTIKADCAYYEKMQHGFAWLELIECKDSKKTNLYQLVKNGEELWYGTLKESNAIVKTLIKLEEAAS